MTQSADLRTTLSAIKGSSKSEFNRSLKALFSLSFEAVPIADDDALFEFFVAAINAIYAKSDSYESLIDADNAKKTLQNETLTKDDFPRCCWHDYLDHFGTHHAKTRNDKSATTGFFSKCSPEAPTARLGLVFSSLLDPRIGAKVSATGDASNSKHYRFLSLTVVINENAASVFEHLAAKEPQLLKILNTLGLPTEEIDILCDAAHRVIQRVNTDRIDKGDKQVFVPFPSGEQAHTLITPVTSTHVVTSMKYKQINRDTESTSLFLQSLSVGGDKPLNAGPLIAELGGRLSLFPAGFPREKFKEIEKLVAKFSRKFPFQASKRNPHIQKLRSLLESMDEGVPLPKQQLRRSVTETTRQLVSDDIDDLYSMKDYLDARKGESDSLPEGLQSLPPVLLYFLDPNREEPSQLELRMQLVALQLAKIERAYGILGDDFKELMQKVLSSVVAAELR